MPSNSPAYAHAYYEKHKLVLKARAKAHNVTQRVRLRAIISEAKARPCMDCAVQYPSYVMQFDHREDEQKDGHIADMVGRQVSVDRLLAEIAKCDVVCANCHAERTHQRG